jgi:hypothetical protein
MQGSNLIEMVATLSKEVAQLRKEIRYGTQVYPQKAIIHSVADPENWGRVQVVLPLTHPSMVSDWMYTLGFSSGRVPEQYIGTSGIAIFLDGNEADGVFIGVIGDQPESAVIKGNPLSIPVIDIRANTSIPECNTESEGQLLLFTNTISVDLKVCIRRNVVDNTNNEGERVKKSLYSWKSITHSLDLGVGSYGESNKEDSEFGDTRTNKSWSRCTEALEGERRLFSEDRRLPQAEFICRKQPGEKYVWMPANSLPLYTLINLPPCTEEFIGAAAMLDDGMNSELVVCSRYQAKNNMKWVKFKRDPVKPAAKPSITTKDIVENEEATTAPEALLSTLQTIDFSKAIGSQNSALFSILTKIKEAVGSAN